MSLQTALPSTSSYETCTTEAQLLLGKLQHAQVRSDGQRRHLSGLESQVLQQKVRCFEAIERKYQLLLNELNDLRDKWNDDYCVELIFFLGVWS